MNTKEIKIIDLNNQINLIIESNKSFNKEYENLINELFLNTYIELGKENFAKVLSKKNLDKTLEKTIYYVLNKNNVNFEELEDSSTIQNIEVNEVNKFELIFKEGITYYLKCIAIDNNVIVDVFSFNFIKLLVEELIGKRILKIYLTKNVEALNSEILNLINYDGKVSISDNNNYISVLNNMYSINKSLEAYDEILKYITDENEIKEIKLECTDLQNYKDVIKEYILEFSQRLIIGKIYKNIYSFKYYQDNKLNSLNLIVKLNYLLEKMLYLLRIFEISNEDKEKFEQDILRKSIKYLIENSPIYYDSLENKMVNIEALIEDIINTNRINYKYDLNIESILKKLIIIRKDYFKSISANKYIIFLAQVFNQLNIKNEDKIKILFESNKLILGENNLSAISCHIDNVLNKICYLEKIRSLNFSDILNHELYKVNDSKFIEKKDNKYFSINLIDGYFEEEELENTSEIINHKFVKIEKFENQIIYSEFASDIINNINSGRYMIDKRDSAKWFDIPGLIINTDTDASTRNIDFKDYIFDLKNLLRFVSEEDKFTYIKLYTFDLLDEVFGIKDNNEFSIPKVQKSYNFILNGIVSQIANDKFDNDLLLKMEEAADILSSLRKLRIRRNLANADIEFEKTLRGSNLANEIDVEKLKEAKEYANDIISEFDYKKYYYSIGLLPIDELGYQIKGVTTTSPIDSRSIDFDFVGFLTDAKLSLISLNRNLLIDTFTKIFVTQMGKTYGLYGISKENNPEVYAALARINAKFRENLINGGMVDELALLADFDILNEYRKKKVEKDKKSSYIKFLNDNSKQAFLFWNTYFNEVSKVKNNEDKIRQTFYQVTGEKEGIIDDRVSSIDNLEKE